MFPSINTLHHNSKFNRFPISVLWSLLPSECSLNIFSMCTFLKQPRCKVPLSRRILVTKNLRSLLYHSLRGLKKPNLGLLVIDAGKDISSSNFLTMYFVRMNLIRSEGDNLKDNSTTPLSKNGYLATTKYASW